MPEWHGWIEMCCSSLKRTSNLSSVNTVGSIVAIRGVCRASPTTAGATIPLSGTSGCSVSRKGKVKQINDYGQRTRTRRRTPTTDDRRNLSLISPHRGSTSTTLHSPSCRRLRRLPSSQSTRRILMPRRRQRRPRTEDPLVCHGHSGPWTAMLTCLSRYCVSTAAVEGMAVSTVSLLGSCLLITTQTYPHPQNRPTALLRRRHRLCSNRWIVAVGKCAGESRSSTVEDAALTGFIIAGPRDHHRLLGLQQHRDR